MCFFQLEKKHVEFGWFPRCPLGGLAVGRLAHLFKLSFRMQSVDQTDHSTSHARRPMRSYQVLNRLQMAIAMRWRCLSGFWKVSQTEYQSTVYQSIKNLTCDVGSNLNTKKLHISKTKINHDSILKTGLPHLPGKSNLPCHS